jgi:hypothetical protein
MKKNYPSRIHTLKGFVSAMMFVSFTGMAQTYTFTTAGVTGSAGPTQTQANTAYSGSSLAGSVTVNNGIQSFTVPFSGLYLIDAYGASGGNTNSTYNRIGGLGSRLRGEFNLTSGDVLTIMVGQKGADGCGGAGGGGGSHVVRNGTILLISAGAGGGATSNNDGGQSVTGLNGTNDNPGGAVPGGTMGMGGQACNVGSPGANHGGGGGGYVGNGATSTASSPGGGGFSFLNGGLGGYGFAPGGFGGGGGATNCTVGGGGGGGYSGGAGGQQVNYCLSGPQRTGGGGGGSFNAATSQTNTPATNLGNGKVIITELCRVMITASGSNSVSPVLCAGSSMTLTSNVVTNFTWSTGNTTSASIVVSPSVTTTYSVIGTTSANCTAYTTITVTVSSGPPVLTVAATPSQVCLGQSATITASGALTYSTTNGVTLGVSFTPTVSSTYTISGENGCGVTTAVRSISVAPLLVSPASSPTVVCQSNPAVLNVTAAATSFSWLPTNFVTTTPSVIVSPSVSTIYTVSVSDGTCSGTGTVALSVSPNPTVTSSSSTMNICPGESSTLSALGALSYTWNPGGAVSPSIVVSPTVPTLYSVTGVNSFNCFGYSSQPIIVGSSPFVVATANKFVVCSGGSVILVASGADNYSWVNGPATYTYAVVLSQPAEFTVTGTAQGKDCPAMATVSVNVVTATLGISGTPSVCAGGTATLTSSAGSGLVWQPSGLTFQTINPKPTASTVYTLSGNLTFTSLLCPVSQTFQVNVHPNPTITASASRSVFCSNEVVSLNASGASSYTWTNLQGQQIGTSGTITVSQTLAGPFSYTVIGATTEGCQTTKALAVIVNACNSISEAAPANSLRIYPNPANGEFVIVGSAASSLLLVNEIGQVIQKIYLTQENGFSNSVKELAEGIYFVTDPANPGLVKEKIIVTR